MPNTQLDSLHETLRRALNAGDFDAARQLADSFGSAISEELIAAPPAIRAGLLQQRLSMLQENLSLAQVLRAHLASQLQTNTAVCLYQPDSGIDYSWTLDA